MVVDDAAPGIVPERFVDALVAAGVDFFAGVPDSLLKHFCACVNDRLQAENHVITANEGSAVALAMGRQIGAGGLPVVYMQNSGLGNAINPLLSLADEAVYAIPMLLVIGWRGEMDDDAQLPDEPQHAKQGRVTLPLLKAMEIPHEVINGDSQSALRAVAQMSEVAQRDSRPAALLVRKGSFLPYPSVAKPGHAPTFPLSREEAIRTIIAMIPRDAIVVATTGMASRELYELRESRNEGHERDFLTVGGMGHASQIALGIAQSRPQATVVCLDGDGALLMHMGGLVYSARQPNLVHVVLNNGSHDSVGGQPTLAHSLDLAAIAHACGFARTYRAENTEQLQWVLREMFGNTHRGGFVEVLCRTGHRADLGRPQSSPRENKNTLQCALAGAAERREKTA